MTSRQPSLHAISEGGIAGDHVVTPAPPVFLSPTLSGQERNTIRLAVIPFACWRAEDLRFEFDSSFLLPGIASEFTALKSLIDAHTVRGTSGQTVLPALSVFGHADPTGNDEYNKALSGRRAQAVFAALVRDTDLWADLFDHPHGNDQWNPKALKIMQAALGRSPDPQVRGAARTALFRDYMDLICTERDEFGLPVTNAFGEPGSLLLERTAFLARGADPKGKGDFQGCGEFNPGLIFSSDEQQAFSVAEDKTERNEANAPNRRVVIYLFRPGISIAPADWPCPRVKEGTAGCRRRLWSDASQRLAPGDERREFSISQDTFACRFYHRLADRSPCEGHKPTRIGRLFMQILDGDGRVLLAQRKYRIRRVASERALFAGVLDDDATLLHDFVPDGDYLLKVDGCAEETPMIVQETTDDVPTVRHLETSELSVLVSNTDGQPLHEATVTVRGLGSLQTDADGVAAFGLVDPGDFEFTASKDDHLVDAAPVTRSAFRDVVALSDSATGTVKVGFSKARAFAQLKAKPAPVPKVTVKEIKGTLPATKSLRNPAPRTLAPNVLKPSTSDSSDPIDHVVLVRHKAQVVLEATTDPPGELVRWDVVHNRSTAAKPRFAADSAGTLTVTLNAAGSFSAVATSKTGSTLRWNFVIVGVEVNEATAKVTTRDNLFVDAAKHLASTPSTEFSVPVTHVAAMCGDFVFGKHAWDSELEIKLVGGGPTGTIGVERVTPRYLQNLEASNVVGEYPQGALGQSAPNLEKGRILDADGTAGSEPGPIIGVVSAGPQTVKGVWPVCTRPGMVRVDLPNPADKTTIRMKLGDSPSSGAFTARLAFPDGKLRAIMKISGFMQFAATVASWSTDAPNAVAIHAAHEWLIDYAGVVKFPNGSTRRAEYSPAGAHVTNVTPWHRINPADGGLDAAEAIMEIFGPLLTTISNGNQIDKF